MAQKDTKGQLNMFDFFGEDVQMVSLMPDDEFIDDAIGAGLDQDMSGFEDDFSMEVARPEDIPEEEPLKKEKTVEEPEGKYVDKPAEEEKMGEKPAREAGGNTYHLTLKDTNRPVMARCFSLSGNTVDGVVAYLDYNRVYVKELGKSPVSYQFQTSKAAVNFYVEQMQLMRKDNVMKMIDKEAMIVATEPILMEE